MTTTKEEQHTKIKKNIYNLKKKGLLKNKLELSTFYLDRWISYSGFPPPLHSVWSVSVQPAFLSWLVLFHKQLSSIQPFSSYVRFFSRVVIWRPSPHHFPAFRFPEEEFLLRKSDLVEGELRWLVGAEEGFGRDRLAWEKKAEDEKEKIKQLCFCHCKLYNFNLNPIIYSKVQPILIWGETNLLNIKTMQSQLLYTCRK